jgi:hypothetical protein
MRIPELDEQPALGLTIRARPRMIPEQAGVAHIGRVRGAGIRAGRLG